MNGRVRQAREVGLAGHIAAHDDEAKEDIVEEGEDDPEEHAEEDDKGLKEEPMWQILIAKIQPF